MQRWLDAFGAALCSALIAIAVATPVGAQAGAMATPKSPKAAAKQSKNANGQGKKSGQTKKGNQDKPRRPRQPADAVRRFRTPDGSRFVLVPTPGVPQVQWAIASIADAATDPPAMRGLAAAVQQASLGGTWEIGSADRAREREALTKLAATQNALLEKPGDPTLMQELQAAEALAARLGDPRIFDRVLAAAPAHAPEVRVDDVVAIFQLTTIPSAIGEVGALLVQRRERQVLRNLPQHWFAETRTRQARYAANPLAPAYAELLALAMPRSPEADAAGPPGRAIPRREQAMAVWHATQHPSRTVHVLLGGFDADAVKAILDTTFRSTALPTPPTVARERPRAFTASRRSVVPGTGRRAVLLAWPLAKVKNPLELSNATRWLTGGSPSRLTRELRRKGRAKAVARARAPWPEAVGGRSLFVLEVEDPSGTDGLADLVTNLCRSLTAKAPPQGQLAQALRQVRSNWSLVTGDPRWHAREIARHVLLWPGQPLPKTPQTAAPGAVHRLLKATFRPHPVVVETRP